MNRPLPAGLPVHGLPLLAEQNGPLVRPDGRPQRSKPLMRKYEVAYLAPNGEEKRLARIAPAAPTFESAFLAFARGTIFATREGPIAVEDLSPGMELLTSDHGCQPLLWKGSTTIKAAAPGRPGPDYTLIRFQTESIGLGRPAQDLMLANAARLFCAKPADTYGGHFKTATRWVDDLSTFEIRPPAPVEVFHLAVEVHSRLIANGVEVESFHPGPMPRWAAGSQMQSLYLSMFPHITAIEEFGPLAYPRDVDDDQSTNVFFV